MVAFSILVVGCGTNKKETSKKEESKKIEETNKNDETKEDNEEKNLVITLVGKAEGVEMLDNSSPTITLQKIERRFQFCISPLSSYLPMGMYEETDEELILNVDNSSKKEKYVFKIKGDKYIFDAKQSAEVPKIKMTAKGKPQEVVPDGMVFTAVNQIKKCEVKLYN